MTIPRKGLKNLNRAWAAGLIALSVITLSFSAQANEAGTQKMTYSVYAGGIHALDATLDIDAHQSDKYAVSLYAKTHGLLGKLAPWFGTFESKGWLNASVQSAKPEKHISSTSWKDELEVKTYRYAQDGTFMGYSVKDEDEDGSIKKTDDKLTQQTTDILSATLEAMMQVAATNKCEGQSEVFDGKRRYKLIFDHKKEALLTKSKYNVYEGKAIECTVRVEPKGGKWHAKPRGWFAIQEQGRKKGSIPTVWLASLKDGAPAIPVKVRAKTNYGTFFLHLQSYAGGDTKLALK